MLTREKTQTMKSLTCYLTPLIATAGLLIACRAEEPVVEHGGDEVLEAPAKRAARLVKALDKSANPVVNYELQLREWLGDYLKK